MIAPNLRRISLDSTISIDAMMEVEQCPFGFDQTIMPEINTETLTTLFGGKYTNYWAKSPVHPQLHIPLQQKLMVEMMETMTILSQINHLILAHGIIGQLYGVVVTKKLYKWNS